MFHGFFLPKPAAILLFSGISMASRKIHTALLSIASNTLLICMKVVVCVITGSMSIISEAIHSGMDLVAAFIAFASVRVSDNPPDKDHPYGHGKVENVSGAIEAVLIVAASGFIIYKAIKKLFLNEPVESLGLGFFVMMVSAAVNTYVSWALYRVAKKEESIALAADALHLKVDVYTSLGVALGLGILWCINFFWHIKLYFLDPVIAILIALFILKEAWDMLRVAYRPLVDTALTEDEIVRVKDAIRRSSGAFVDFHNLRTRRAGKFKYVDLHLTMPPTMTIAESHAICDGIEKEIEKTLTNVSVEIHSEPCIENCSACRVASPGECQGNKNAPPDHKVKKERL
jgi:cation diffusion facilitator family transporter